MSERTEAQRIATLEKRLDLVLKALRGEFSGLGRQFGTPTFQDLWNAAEEDEE